MRYFLVLTLFLLGACSGEPGPVNQRSDAITRLSDSDARGLDPQIVSDIASVRIAADQFEGLTRFNAQGLAEPGLAADWTVSDDGLIWTFMLRPNLKFSDGAPLTSEVFAAAIKRIRDERSGSPHGGLFNGIDTVTAPTPDSVIVRLKTPFPQLPALLAHPAIAALPFHRITAKGEGWTADRPLVTSGPYRLTEWKLNDHIMLMANPAYYGGKPATNAVVWRPMDNILSGMRQILAGGADTSSDFPANRNAWLQERYPQLVRNHAFMATYYFAFNTRRPPFDDVRVRRALSMAVDREWMANKMVAAGNAPAYGLLPPGLAGSAAQRPVWANWSKEKRLSAARALLTAAGYSATRPLRFEIRFNSSAEHRRAAASLATMWRALGVDAALLNSEASLHFDSLKRADFALARSGWIADLPAPENFLAVHRSDTGPQNYSGYANPAYDAALDAALAEPDTAVRVTKMRAAEAILIEDAPILPLYFYVSRALVQTRVTGWTDNDANVHPSRTLGIKRP